ncbi:zinc-ribbon domain and TM2 domain-containing protein [Haloarcula marina]|uniref:zinc-ribbon domain and TM2 domain-containing protein n=1 Tax=Haloarcula marina TaxID=2961574 RepID=UPI0020B6AD6A|nr:NINE protein [Halomicroarcula marina]
MSPDDDEGPPSDDESSVSDEPTDAEREHSDDSESITEDDSAAGTDDSTAQYDPETGERVDETDAEPAASDGAADGQKFCHACGTQISAGAKFCPDCGAQQDGAVGSESGSREVDRVTAGIFAILLGGLGVHHFYLGNVGLGVLYLCFSWTFIPALVGVIEGIIYLTKTDEEFQRQYGRE